MRERRTPILKFGPVKAAIAAVLSLSAVAAARPAEKADIVVLISANAEWAPVRDRLARLRPAPTPYGEFAAGQIAAGGKKRSIIYFHGGWGKISAAASAQYALDRWAPQLLVNLGTCGGFEGEVRPDDILLVNKTVVYDIIEMMGNADEAIASYTTALDLTWLVRPYPTRVVESLLVSADRDLQPAEIPALHRKFGAVAGDWESGAIAYVAVRNKVRCLILRTVSDIVGAKGSDAYGNLEVFQQRSRTIMNRLLDILPSWLKAAERAFAEVGGT